MASATPDGSVAGVGATAMQWRRAVTWEPRRLGWRIAALFMAGSFLFALGSFPAYAQLVDPGTVGITFVVGSILFTAAGCSAFFEEINRPDPGEAAPPRTRYWAWMPHRALWWAADVPASGENATR